MDNKQYIVALEIGSSKIVGAIATHSALAGVSVVAVEEESVVDCVRYGVIQNIEEVNTRVGRIIHKLENRAVVAPRKIKSLYVGVQGRSMHNYVAQVSKQFTETTITEKVIDEMKTECREIAKKQIDGFEIVGTIPRKYLVDKTETQKPVGTLGSSIDAYFNLIIAKPQVRGNIRRLMEKQQVEVNGYFVVPNCVAEAVLSNEERRLGCMLVDFGAETTTVSIYKNDVLIYLATIPVGSRNITKDITALNILEERAEEIKKSVGNANVQPSDKSVLIYDINSGDINNYVAARSGEIVANIMAQLEYAKCTVEDIPGGIIIGGGGVKLKGFADVIATQYKGKIREGNIDSVDFTNTKAQGVEYVPVVSMLCRAARVMKAGASCCSEPPSTGDATGGATTTTGSTTTTTTTPATPANGDDEKKPKKKSPGKIATLFGSIKTKVANIFEEPEEGEDEDDEEDNNDE